MDEQDIKIAEAVDQAFVDGLGEPEAYELVAKQFNIGNIQYVIDQYEEWLDVPPEHDGQPDEAQEWHDFDPDC